jgi:hypothetical protein
VNLAGQHIVPRKDPFSGLLGGLLRIKARQQR